MPRLLVELHRHEEARRLSRQRQGLSCCGEWFLTVPVSQMLGRLVEGVVEMAKATGIRPPGPNGLPGTGTINSMRSDEAKESNRCMWHMAIIAQAAGGVGGVMGVLRYLMSFFRMKLRADGICTGLRL